MVAASHTRSSSTVAHAALLTGRPRPVACHARRARRAAVHGRCRVAACRSRPQLHLRATATTPHGGTVEAWVGAAHGSTAAPRARRAPPVAPAAAARRTECRLRHRPPPLPAAVATRRCWARRHFKDLLMSARCHPKARPGSGCGGGGAPPPHLDGVHPGGSACELTNTQEDEVAGSRAGAGVARTPNHAAKRTAATCSPRAALRPASPSPVDGRRSRRALRTCGKSVLHCRAAQTVRAERVLGGARNALLRPEVGEFGT
mmetsp:Transcript_46495/g.122583  ORF Transcript_46495/g.122583 Transcript_46495/m.122583 type:complete len:260 (-) Transcript_46495:64-843(-)